MKWNRLLYVLLLSGIGAFSYLLLVNYTDLPPRVTDVFNSKGAFVFFVLVFNVVGYFTIRLSSWINDQYTLNIRRRWRIIAVYAAGMLLFLLLNYSLLTTAKLLAGVSSPFTFQSGGWRILIVVWLIELVIMGLLIANRSIQNTLRLQQEAAALQEENNRAHYAALQNQLDPHFLFNNLNTLIAEIEYNPANAVNFTKNLSDVYRYVLQCREKTLVSLNDELEFVQSYLFLHKVRLGDCISCECRLPTDHPDMMIPPLTLQLLVENVIKHNSITRNKPMKIQIGIDEDYLKVSNPIQPKRSNESSGVGLANLSKRSKLISGKDIRIDTQDNIFTVKVPLLYE